MAQVRGSVGPDQLTIDPLHYAQTLVLPGTCRQPEWSEGQEEETKGEVEVEGEEKEK